MINCPQQQTGQNTLPQEQTHAMPSCSFTPAPQPQMPEKDCCKPPCPGQETPKVPETAPHKMSCNCSATQTNGTLNCSYIDQLIAKQTGKIKEAERANTFKAELTNLAQKIKAAQEEYTVDKYNRLLDSWKTEDEAIVRLIEKLICVVKCWRCVIECRVCTLYYAVLDIEKRLNGSGTLYEKVDSLYDLRYWLERDKEAKQATFDRIKAVLAAWEKPAQTIEKVINDNTKLIENAGKTLAPDAAPLLYDVFLKLIPMHLLIAPPKTVAQTNIGKVYTNLCPCDSGEPDDCCGPDVGPPSLLKRLLGPQPYLVQPEQVSQIICCLTEHRFWPAQEALAEVEGKLEMTKGEIDKAKIDIENMKKSLERNAKSALEKPIDCKQYELSQENGAQQEQGRGSPGNSAQSSESGNHSPLPTNTSIGSDAGEPPCPNT